MQNCTSLEQENLDLKEKLRVHEELLRTDTISGLPNRVVLEEKITSDKTYSVMMLTIDNFDTIDYAFGRLFAENTIKQASKLLKRVLLNNIELFRLASGEFVILTDQPNIIEEKKIAQSIKSFFDIYSIEFEDIEIKISFSIGIYSGKSEDLLKNSRVAMIEAISMGANRYRFFQKNGQLADEREQNIYWIHKIRDALMEDTITPYFQPIRDNRSGEIYKYECLVRIVEHNKVITPWYFTDAAKMTGLLTNLTKVMIDKSFNVFKNRTEEFSINITQDDLKSGYLKEFLMHKCHRYAIEPSRVTLEILEDIEGNQDSETIFLQLVELREDGFKVAIDDFGSEGSNFSRVLQMKADYIKIDGQFIKDIESSEDSRHIVEAINAFAKKIGVKTVAEFVHNENVLNIIKDIGIDYAQGYFISEPMDKPL